MARPIKNNADYFPHDSDMRNDTRIKAVRRKFGMIGYGVYCMLLEFLTDSEFFEFKNDSLSIELVAGDFDIEPDKLNEILQYFMQLDLIQMDAKTSIISCKSLDNRLEPLLSKRKRDRIGVIADDNTQSKVKESKEEETKEKKSKVTVADAPEILPFDSINFKIVWDEWIAYKKERKQKFTSRTKEMQLRKLGARPELEAIGMVRQSIENGWTGIFELRKYDNIGTNKTTLNGTRARSGDYSEQL